MVKKNKEEIILEIFKTFEHILTKIMVIYVLQICYIKVIKYFRDGFIPFRLLYAFANFKTNEFIKLKYSFYLLCFLVLNILYLSLIFYYDTFVYAYIMEDRLERIMLNY
uniref:Ribosomal protein S11 n=1 Tax=Heterostelium pallidum TaxID=13642 RepID=B2XX56_HETPA|nr:ribosomal protein S11 [Heterostelium pallidum]